MGKKDNPFGDKERPTTDPFGRPISDSQDAFGSPADSADAFGSPAESAVDFGTSARNDASGSSATAGRATPPSSGDPWRRTPSPSSADARRTAPPPTSDPWRTAPRPDADYPAQAPDRVADAAVPALVLSLFGLFCWILSPFAWGLGRKAEREIDASGGTLGGRGMASAGKVIGIIGTVLLVLGILFVILGLGLGATVQSPSVTTAPR